MKREPNTNPNRNPNGSGRGNGSHNGNRTDTGFVQSTPAGNNTYGKDGDIFNSGDLSNTVTEFVPIRQTPAYKHAYELFSKLEDKKWLMRLESIADSVPYYEPNSWLSEIFNKEKYWNKNIEAVSLGVQQINALVAEYQEFENSLPKTQAQQFADANLNPLTQSYGGSNINPQNTLTSAGVPDITPTSEIIGSLVSLATSASGGLLSFVTTGFSVFKNLQDAKIQERNQLLELASKGITPKPSDVLRSNKDFLVQRLFPSTFTSSSVNKMAKEEDDTEIQRVLAEDLRGTIFAGEDISDAYKDLSKLNYELFMQDYRSRNSALKRQSSEDDFQSSVIDQLDPKAVAMQQKTDVLSETMSNITSAEKSKSDRSIEKTFQSILNKWIDKAQNGSFVHQYLIMNLRTSGNTGVSDAIHNATSIGSALTK